MKLIYEIFDEVALRESRADKIAVLRYNSNYALKSILKAVFNPNIQFDVEVPVYKKSDAPIGLGYTTIHNELNRVYLFEKNNPRTDPNLTKERKKQLLIQVLESLEAREAEIYASMINKKLDVDGLTLDLVKEAFPDLF